MARLAVLASGNGGNFQALVEALRSRGRAPRHDCVLLIYDRAAAFAAQRAQALGVPARYIAYRGRPREEAEAEILAALTSAGADIVALAGFMRLLSPLAVSPLSGRLVNVHPALLPSWPGTDSIRRSFEAGERTFGATVHLVDEGMDTGPVLAAESFTAGPGDTLETIVRRVHEIEHGIYPKVVLDLLDQAERRRER